MDSFPLNAPMDALFANPRNRSFFYTRDCACHPASLSSLHWRSLARPAGYYAHSAYRHDNAVLGSGLWGGRLDEDGEMYIGATHASL